MPTYEYICSACHHAWEAFQPMSADPLRDCPKCHKPQAKRQISLGAGFILKGGGWYSDLYSSAKPSTDGSGSSSSGSGGATSGGSSGGSTTSTTSDSGAGSSGGTGGTSSGSDGSKANASTSAAPNAPAD